MILINVSSMKFNLLRIIELPLRSRTEFCDGLPERER